MIQEGSRNSMSRHSPQPSNIVKDARSVLIVSYTLYNSKNNCGERIKVVNEGGQRQIRKNHDHDTQLQRKLGHIGTSCSFLFQSRQKSRVRNAPKLKVFECQDDVSSGKSHTNPNVTCHFQNII